MCTEIVNTEKPPKYFCGRNLLNNLRLRRKGLEKWKNFPKKSARFGQKRVFDYVSFVAGDIAAWLDRRLRQDRVKVRTGGDLGMNRRGEQVGRPGGMVGGRL